MTLKAIYSKLETNKSLKELLEGLERLNVRSENGKKVDAFLHYEDGSIRWIPFRKQDNIMIFEILSKSGLHTVTVTTKPANGDPTYTVFHGGDGNSFHCGGLLKPGDNLKKAVTTQAKRMWIGVQSVKEVK